MLEYVPLPSSLAASCSRSSLASRSAADAVRAAIDRFEMLGPAIASLGMHDIVDIRRHLAAERPDSGSTITNGIKKSVGGAQGRSEGTDAIHPHYSHHSGGAQKFEFTVGTT